MEDLRKNKTPMLLSCWKDVTDWLDDVTDWLDDVTDWLDDVADWPPIGC